MIPGVNVVLGPELDQVKTQMQELEEVVNGNETELGLAQEVSQHLAQSITSTEGLHGQIRVVAGDVEYKDDDNTWKKTTKLGRKEYTLFEGVLTSGTAAFTLPSEITSYAEFAELRLHVGTSNAYGNMLLSLKPATSVTYSYATIAGGPPLLHWLKVTVVASGITIDYNRSARADGTETNLNSTATWVSRLVGVKYA